MNAVRHFERLFIDRRRSFDQQDTNAGGIQERDAFVGQSRQILAADNLGVEFVLLSTSLTGMLKCATPLNSTISRALPFRDARYASAKRIALDPSLNLPEHDLAPQILRAPHRMIRPPRHSQPAKPSSMGCGMATRLSSPPPFLARPPGSIGRDACARSLRS